MKKLFLLPLIAIFLFACSNSESDATTDDMDTTAIIDTVADEMMVENEVDSAEVEEEPETIIPPKETKVLSKATFCDCIKRQKKIDDELEAAETDAEIDAVLKAMDELQEGECKELLNDGQTSPDQRAERKRKIAKCLGS